MLYKTNNTQNDIKNQAVGEKIFQDVRKNGKKNDWRGKKLRNLKYADYLHDLNYKKTENVKLCAETMVFEPTETGHLKLKQTWFCKSRLCPLCNWRRSMKHANQVAQIIDKAVSDEPKGRFLFWTFTAKNVYDGETLNASLSQLSKAFNRLTRYKKIAQNLLGFLKATEVTINPVDNSYNQHLHVLVFVKSSYFTGNGTNYITQEELTDLWQRALKSDYKPIVDIRAVKPQKMVNRNQESLLGAIYETAKYPVKDVDFLTDDDANNLKRIDDLEKGLKHKRLISYGGVFKTIRKVLQLKDVETDELIDTDSDEDKEATTGEQIIAYWNWQRKNYFIKQVDGR